MEEPRIEEGEEKQNKQLDVAPALITVHPSHKSVAVTVGSDLRVFNLTDNSPVTLVDESTAQDSIVKLLSSVDESKSVISSTDDEGWAPLHSAASIGKAELVEILLTRGADVNVKNNGGRTALHYAASKGWLEIAQLLLTHGAKINITGKSEVCEFLIEEGAEIDAMDKMGQTPLMHSVICDDRQVAFLLVRHGADVDVEDKEGYTILGREREREERSRQQVELLSW